MDNLIPPHGGYKNLKTFQLSQLIFDITVRFCKRFITKNSRTNDQMVQAARSGVQNIAEGSQASGTSKKTEIKLTNVARSSLEELRLDYQDYLRQNNLPLWLKNDPRRNEIIRERFTTGDKFAIWVGKQGDDKLAETAANGVLVLIGVTCCLLNRQLSAQADAFKRDGGFTERLYRTRVEVRQKGP